jgi:hypothetical protein
VSADDRVERRIEIVDTLAKRAYHVLRVEGSAAQPAAIRVASRAARSAMTLR